jgi:tyrosyl-tRNA synthetase
MPAYKSEFMRTIVERGYLHQCTDAEALDGLAAEGKLVAYVGYDCTADSLHIGHLVSIMMLRWLQRTGNTAIVLMGDGTTKVGDPSGRDETRKLLSEEDIQTNVSAIRRSFANFVSFDATGGHKPALMVNNAEWLDKLLYIPLLRDVGRHFSVNRMLTMDSVRLRLEREQPLSFLEFNYMVLQSYDFVELARRYGCNLQMGGSDQWGNIVMGVELGRRVEDRALIGLTTPLITTASGAKMGKTAAGAVWLNPDRLGPYDYWQFWRNTEDGDVGRFLKLFTGLPLDEIVRLEALQGAEINEAKKVLATEATRLCHGSDAAEAAAETARKTFEEGTLGEDLPSIAIARARLEAGVPAFELLHEAGLVPSKGEARRLIKGGGGRLNDKPIASDTTMISLADADQGVIKLSAGRKRHALVRVG